MYPEKLFSREYPCTPKLRGGTTPYSEARVFPAGNCVASSPLTPPFPGTA